MPASDLDRYPVLPFMQRACELWTRDRRLANAHGPACVIRVLT